ncbi:hypothetical protein [Marinactinospora rubrisoli]|uniref:Uncharacterized protein n=1 Tax=Marinactinospora rubrisoli TaxID=2715399 RepID=A0ABW2KCC5_9ACTN
MIDAFRAAFQELIDSALATDPQRFGAAVGEVYGLARQVPADEREIAVEALAPIFSGHHTVPGIAADLMVVAGALVELGTPPGATGVEILRRLRETGAAAGVFLHAWDQTGGGAPPEPEEVTAADEERVAQILGESAPAATMCWWTARRHGLAAKTMLSESAVRSAVCSDVTLHSELLPIARRLAQYLPEYREIDALLRMGEATSAVVLDRASGRGFRVRFDGIGDNFQLHTLLADALIGPEGRGLAGERPDPLWVSAFRDGEPVREADPVRGSWNLVAADGSWIWNEGVPADIPVVEGERVIVLDEQPYVRTWNAGRMHPHVVGSLDVLDELTAEEARTWWARVAPSHSPHNAFGGGPAPNADAGQEDATPGPEAAPSPAAGPVEVPFADAEPAGDPLAPPPADSRPADLPPPPTEEPAWRPAPVGTATERFPAIADDPVRGSGEPRPGRTGAPDATSGEDEDDSGVPPGARLLPPLPPGVSDSSGWAPPWRR